MLETYGFVRIRVASVFVMSEGKVHVDGISLSYVIRVHMKK